MISKGWIEGGRIRQQVKIIRVQVYVGRQMRNWRILYQNKPDLLFKVKYMTSCICSGRLRYVSLKFVNSGIVLPQIFVVDDKLQKSYYHLLPFPLRHQVIIFGFLSAWKAFRTGSLWRNAILIFFWQTNLPHSLFRPNLCHVLRPHFQYNKDISNLQ